MPKVKDGYFEAKKEAILDAAEKVCRQKPLYKITMKDIIKASGLSPGAMYDSFSGIDELIVALINRLSIKTDYQSRLQEILLGSAPEEKITALVFYLVELVHLTVSSYGKILFELSTVYIDEERRKKIEKGMGDLQIFGQVVAALMQVIEENIDNGYFKPLYPKENVYAILFSFTDGLIRNMTLVNCYQIGSPGAVTFKEKQIPEAMASSIIHLLNHR